METPTIIDTGATLAKCELLARLQQHNKFVVPTAGEIAAAIDAARMPYARGALRLDVAPSCGDDDDELVEQPAPARRQRKRSLAKVCEVARRAGANHVIVDGVVIVLSPSAAVPESNTNEWDAVLSEAGS